MDIQQLRNQYESAGINASELPENPLECLQLWFDLAKRHRPGRWYEPNAMTLATSDSSGRVTARMVLLKGIIPDGIRFFTNYRSCKGRQLDINPQASVVFHWPYLGRQVRIEGSVEKTTREVSEQYFHSRPRGSQIGALASQQSNPVEKEVLTRVVEQIESEFEGRTIPLPENWGGYLLKPVRFEFWQGRLNRLHDRIAYEDAGDGWSRVRLSP